jgi:hypothetical protein
MDSRRQDKQIDTPRYQQLARMRRIKVSPRTRSVSTIAVPSHVALETRYLYFTSTVLTPSGRIVPMSSGCSNEL